MKNIYFLLMLLIFSSCNKKSLQLPEIQNASITEVLDVSPVYMFYNEETDSIELNRKNMISTTNWLVNIDKRLTLEQILPHLQYLQEKRHRDGMHKNENARNYFTCNDTSRNTLGFIDFTDVIYSFKKENDLLEEFSNSIVLKFSEKKITVNDTLIKFEHLNTHLKNLEVQETNIVLTFGSTLTFQEYISIKSTLLQLDLQDVSISNEEFIY